MSDIAGHLFIIHGQIASLVHDAAIVPADGGFTFSPDWQSLTGSRALKPERWDRDGWGRAHGAKDRIWAVSVGGVPADPYEKILQRVVQSLESVDRRRAAHAPVRGCGSLPLVAVPVIGIGRTGYGRDRGTIIKTLVQRLTSAAHDLNLDIALVTPDPAVYSAAQYARRHTATPLPDDLERSAKVLGERARAHDLALFLGSGVGIPAGLPSWEALVAELATAFDVADAGPRDSQLSVTDRAELVELAARNEFPNKLAEIVGAVERPSLLHALLAGLDCKEVVTTNYDLLYEKAVRATKRSIAAVLPWTSAHTAERWVLKLHGDISKGHLKTIVLTRRHMVRYDAVNRPSAAMLQSLLLTKHLLVVGASMTDDNVIRLAHEVQAFREEHQQGVRDTFGTVLDVPGDPVRRRLWAGQFDWHLMADAGIGSGPRAVELFLDRVALHAARDSSWLLDERFEGLLGSEADQQFARQVRDLYASVPSYHGKWRPLVERLEELGLRSTTDHAPRVELRRIHDA